MPSDILKLKQSVFLLKGSEGRFESDKALTLAVIAVEDATQDGKFAVSST